MGEKGIGMHTGNVVPGAIVLMLIATFTFAFSFSAPCAAAGEPILLNGSAKLNQSESMTLKNGYVLTLKAFEFNTTTGAKKVHLVLSKSGAVVDEKIILNEDITKDIGTYTYYKNFSGRSIKILRADLDMWVNELEELINPGTLSRGVEVSKLYQYWDGEPQGIAEPHIRFLWIKGSKGYSLKEGTLEKIYENNVTLNTRSGIVVAHNQMYDESFDARDTTIEIAKGQGTAVYPPKKNFQGERKFLVILDEDNSFPVMNSDDIFVCRAGELYDPSVTYNVSEAGSIAIITPAGERSSVDFTIPDWGATEVGYIFQNTLTNSIPAYSNPSGASIYVDGLQLGKAPLTVRDIPLGRRIIEMQLENYPRWKYDLNLTPSAIGPVSGYGVLYILGQPNANLNISSSPSGARIYIDGYYIRSTPALISGILAGNYLVELQLEGYQNWTKNVSATEGRIEEVSASLEKPAPAPTPIANATATANVTATPAETPKSPGFEAVNGMLSTAAATAMAIAIRKKTRKI